jgi:hypothetical protein
MCNFFTKNVNSSCVDKNLCEKDEDCSPYQGIHMECVSSKCIKKKDGLSTAHYVMIGGTIVNFILMAGLFSCIMCFRKKMQKKQTQRHFAQLQALQMQQRPHQQQVVMPQPRIGGTITIG